MSGSDSAKNLPDYVLPRIASYGDDIAQVDSSTGQRVTFHELWNEVQKTGQWLRSEGIGHGTVIGVCLENSLDYAPFVLGVLQAGAVAALYPHASTSRELNHLISVSKPKALFAPNLNSEQKDVLKSSEIKLLNYKKKYLEPYKCNGSHFSSVQCPATLQCPAILLCSSGSTGLPKEVIITHSNLISALSSVSHLLMEKGKSALGLMPFHHAYGFGLMFMALFQGSPFIIMKKFTFNDFNNVMREYKLCSLHIVPSLLMKLLSEEVPSENLRSLERVLTAAGHISARIHKNVQQKLSPEAKIYHSYGMTEVTHVVSIGEVRQDKIDSVGVILPSMKAKIIRSDGTTADTGELGELCLQGPMLSSGYYNNSIATGQAFTADNWLKTGDIAKIDKDGYLFIIDRVKDIIKYQGYTVSASELEQIIAELKGVQEVAVVGIEHEIYGEVPRAFVVLDKKSKLTEEDIKEAVSKQTSHYKWLRGGVRFIKSMPTVQYMKIDRNQLRSMR